ncbi:hypothetical protein CRUP_009683 [Coryphaenoides rupestris]|nr:hypothetical protein CRUP_009683 [Coryphaenoides rupestris]
MEGERRRWREGEEEVNVEGKEEGKGMEVVVVWGLGVAMAPPTPHNAAPSSRGPSPYLRVSLEVSLLKRLVVARVRAWGRGVASWDRVGEVGAAWWEEEEEERGGGPAVPDLAPVEVAATDVPLAAGKVGRGRGGEEGGARRPGDAVAWRGRRAEAGGWRR